MRFLSAPKTSLFGLILGASLAAHSANYEFHVPVASLVVTPAGSTATPTPEPVTPEPTTEPTTEPLAMLLGTAALPNATVGTAYSYDFKSLLSMTGTTIPPLSAVSWSTSSTLPAGLTLSATGVLSGTPTVRTDGAGASFQVVARHEDTNGQQIYTIVVNGVLLQVTQISAGGSHACAVTTAGGLKCWGADAHGELGNDSNLVAQSTPQDVQGLTSGVALVSAGGWHTCAVTTAGALKCWGADNYNQLGNGASQADSPVPVDVVGMGSGVAKISAAFVHTCAVTTAGAVKCWGEDYYGQLGDGGANAQQGTPVAVSGLSSGAAGIVTGPQHSCAILGTGGVKCWGQALYGQIGDGTTVDKTTPVNVVGLSSGVASISTRGHTTCVRTTAGAAKCWGRNNLGQVGIGSVGTDQLSPVTVSGLGSGVARVTAGGEHACALLTDGTLQCWGRNTYGQLGDGTTVNRSLPTPVVGLEGTVSALTSGGNSTCVILSTGTAKCWGFNSMYQLGDGTNANRSTPVDVYAN